MSGPNSPVDEKSSERTARLYNSEHSPFSPASVVRGGFFATCGRGQTLKKTLLAEIKKPGDRKQLGGSDCNCYRTNTSVMCRSCGSTFKGRVRMPCPSHPHTIHLMDMVYCPSCRATTLKEFVVKTPRSQVTKQQKRQF